MANQLDKPWVEDETPAIRKAIECDVVVIVDEIRRRWSPLSIILAGSFGKGEGSVLLQNNRLKYLSDFEISVVRRRPIRPSDLKSVGSRLQEQLGTDIGLYYNAPWKYTSRSLQRLFWRPGFLPVNYFDRRYSARILDGVDYIAQMPDLSPRDIPVWEGLRLIFNRIGQGLGMLDLSFLDNRSETLAPSCGAYWLYRIVLACQEALLIACGQFHYKYRVRNDRLKDVYAKEFPELAQQMPQFPTLAEEATNFKLHPRDTVSEPTYSLFVKVQAACRAVAAHLFASELGLALEPADALYNSYVSHPQVRREFYRFPSRVLQHIGNARKLAKRSGRPLRTLLLHHPRPLHQHMNILMLILFLNLDGNDDTAVSNLELVRRKGEETFFLDLPVTERKDSARSAAAKLPAIWECFIM